MEIALKFNIRWFCSQPFNFETALTQIKYELIYNRLTLTSMDGQKVLDICHCNPNMGSFLSHLLETDPIELKETAVS